MNTIYCSDPSAPKTCSPSTLAQTLFLLRDLTGAADVCAGAAVLGAGMFAAAPCCCWNSLELCSMAACSGVKAGVHLHK